MSKRNAVAKEVTHLAGCKTPGDYYFIKDIDSGDRIGIIHSCPCGCGSIGTLFFRGCNRGKAEWDVMGEWPNVTLSPSIGIRTTRGTMTAVAGPDGYHWHGYLRAGVFEEL